MVLQNIQTIPLENLRIDLSNPRNEKQNSQREALAAIASEQGLKLFKLAEDIAVRGLNPSELPLVVETDEAGVFTVVEGNRRITALKLVTSPPLLESMGLPKNLEQRFKTLYERLGDTIPREIACSVLSRQEAIHWIELKHTGENEGVGVVNWNGVQTQRFRGSTPALEAVDYVKDSDYIDDETRQKLQSIAITNVERFLSTEYARQKLGVDIEDGKLIFLPDRDKNESIARLAIVVSDIAHGRIKVTDIDNKAQRIAYADRVAAQPLPQANNNSSNGSGSGTQKVGRSGSPSATARKVSPTRKTLIPPKFKITINHSRLNQIYHELQTLKIDDYSNSCAVMMRVFIELSVDHFAKEKGISLQVTPKPSGGAKANPPPGKLVPKDMSLRKKIETVADYLETNNLCEEADLFGVRSLTSNTNHVLSIDSLNAYVHNRNLNPSASDLKDNWDSIQVFVQHLWA